MMSPTIRRLLDRVRSRERLLRVSGRAAWAMALCAGLFLVACLIDYLVDLRYDTPRALRIGLLAMQVVGWIVAAGMVVLPLFRRRSDEELMALVEEKVPALRGRLSVYSQREGEAPAELGTKARQEPRPPASQLTLSRADPSAEQLANEVYVERLFPGRPFRAVGLLLGVLVLGLIGFVLAEPDMTTALVARAVLIDGDIPRNVALHPVNGAIWPIGEEGVLRFVVTGNVPEADAVGEVRLYAEGQPEIPLELRYDEPFIWSTRVPVREGAFTYAAWLGTARLRTLGKMSYQPRPVVQSLKAMVVLPGMPPEKEQRSGDIEFRRDGAKARVWVISQLVIAAGFVSIRGDQPRLVHLHPEEEQGRAEFDLLPGDRSYSVHVYSHHGLNNREPPTHTIRKLPPLPKESRPAP